MSNRKNSYENTDVTDGGGVEYGSDIHGVAIRTNQIIWDMIKILDKNELFGFHFKAKIAKHKTVIIMTHEEQEMIDRAKRLLRDFSDIPDIVLRGKIKKEKKDSKLIKLVALMAIISLIGFILFEIGLYFYNHQYIFHQKDLKVTDSNDTVVVKLDVAKLKAIKDSFESQNQPIKPEIMSALDVTTAVISDMVPPSKKAQYSSQNLVKSFKGKGGIKFELDDANLSSEDFNGTIKELKSYANHFIKNKNLSKAIKCYDKILDKRDISRDEKLKAITQKADLEVKMGDLNISQREFREALTLSKKLSRKDLTKYIDTTPFILNKLSKVQKDLNRTEESAKKLKNAEIKYLSSLNKFKRLNKKNPKKYRDDLAWSYNVVANFYSNDKNDYNKSIEYRKKALNLYRKLYSKDSKKYRLNLFKTYNSLAKTYMNMEEFELSKKRYIDGFNIIKKSKYKRYIALSYHNLGFISAKRREFKEAEDKYNRALKIYRDINDTNGTIEIYYDKSSLLSYIGKFKDAIDGYKRVIEKSKNIKGIKSKLDIIKSQNAIAWIYISQPKFKNYREAKKLLDSSIILSDSLKDKNLEEYKRSMSKSYSYMAHFLTMQNRLDIALNYYKKSLNLKRDFQTDMRYSILLVSKQDYLNAFRNFENMLEIYKTKSKQAKILMSYGELYKTLDKNRAKELLEKSLKLYKDIYRGDLNSSIEIKKIVTLLK